MNWNELRALRLSELVAKQLSQDQRIQLKKEEEPIRLEIEREIKNHFQKEEELIKEVYKMMEDLEKQGHQFERQKMFPILKNKLAEKKGFVL